MWAVRGRTAVDGVGQPARVTVLPADGLSCCERGFAERQLFGDEAVVEGVSKLESGLRTHRPQCADECTCTRLEELRGPSETLPEPVDLPSWAAGVEEHQRIVRPQAPLDLERFGLLSELAINTAWPVIQASVGRVAACCRRAILESGDRPTILRFWSGGDCRECRSAVDARFCQLPECLPGHRVSQSQCDKRACHVLWL